MNKIKRALISVSNKENLKPLLKVLKKFKIEILSSGGTYKKNGVNTLVMDGIITQRLIELVPKAGIKVIVAEKKGPLPRDPVGITMFTREDLS